MALTVCTMPQCQTTAGCVCDSPVAAKVRTILGDTEARLHDAEAEIAWLKVRERELEERSIQLSTEIEIERRISDGRLTKLLGAEARNAALVKALRDIAELCEPPVPWYVTHERIHEIARAALAGDT